jgi:RHS repeat-associated protein
VEWQYDGLGRRIRQTTLNWLVQSNQWVVTEDLKFVSDRLLYGRHVVDLNASNNVALRTYVWGLDLSETMDGAGGVGGLLWVTLHTGSGPTAGTHFCAYDGNGNVVALASASDGSATGRYEYGPFGEPIGLSGPAAANNPFRFSTKRTCNTTDLILYEYRAHSSSAGWRLSREPIEENYANNIYDLPTNDPLDYVDLDGRFTGTTCPLCGHWYQGWHQYKPHMDPPSLLMGESCKRFPDIVSAIGLANRAMQDGQYATWFRDHGSHGGVYPVRCRGTCKLVCLFGRAAWAYPGLGIGLCPGNLTNWDDVGIASLLIHEVAHHYCPIIGGESCAAEAQEACASALGN